jgi:hypothetical protein
LIFVTHPQAGPRTRGIARGTFKPDAQPTPGTRISVQFGLRAILSDDEVHAPIPVKIREGATPLFPVHFDTTLLPWHRAQTALAITAKPQTTARILAAILGPHGEEILA